MKKLTRQQLRQLVLEAADPDGMDMVSGLAGDVRNIAVDIRRWVFSLPKSVSSRVTSDTILHHLERLDNVAEALEDVAKTADQRQDDREYYRAIGDD